MSSEFLCEGAPPNSNGCHACGRIGHWANDCPRRRTRQPPAPTKGKQRALTAASGGRTADSAASPAVEVAAAPEAANGVPETELGTANGATGCSLKAHEKPGKPSPAAVAAAQAASAAKASGNLAQVAAEKIRKADRAVSDTASGPSDSAVLPGATDQARQQGRPPESQGRKKKARARAKRRH